MANKLIFIFFFILMLLPLAAAEITLNSPNNVYSLGDEIAVKLSIAEEQAVDGLISVTLKCGSYDVPFFVNSITISPDEAKDIDIEPLKLAKTGECVISAELKKYNDTIDSASTAGFEISGKINISSQINKKYLSPGEKIEIIGTAEKANGVAFNGVGTASFDDKSSTLKIKERFSYELELDEKIKSGSHRIRLDLSDADGNSGSAEYEIIVQNVPTAIGIELNQEAFSPGDDLIAEIMIYGQASEELNDSIAATLYNPWGLNVKTKSTGNESFTYTFSNDAPPGNWWIYAFGDGIKERKFFFVEEKEKAEFEIANQTLTIRNTGNVKYQKPVQITLCQDENPENAESMMLEVNIPVDGSETFRLSAPNGNYNITLKTDESEESFPSFLTGKAIAVRTTSLKGKIPQIIVFSFIMAVIALSVLARYKLKSKGVNVTLRNTE